MREKEKKWHKRGNYSHLKKNISIKLSREIKE